MRACSITALALAASLAAGLPVETLAGGSLLTDGQRHYEAGHYKAAWDRFTQAADCGDREAARLALQMHRYGPRLYGQVFGAGPRQLSRWRALERQAGPTPVSQAAECRLAPDADPDAESDQAFGRMQGMG